MTRAALPNPVVIGTPKCGTTALHYYLGLHPQTSMSRPKELNFFQAEPDKSALGPDEQDMVGRERSTWSRGVDWYASHFDPTAPVRGESSPSYVAPWYRGVAERLAAVLPEARLLICVRDPVERAISHLHMRTAAGERREPADALVDPASGYVALGRYSRCSSPSWPASRRSDCSWWTSTSSFTGGARPCAPSSRSPGSTTRSGPR